MKIGRNDICPCGSGKKYKKCCMSKRIKPQQIGVLKKMYDNKDDFATRFLFQMTQIRDCTFPREERNFFDKKYQPIFQNLFEAKFSKELCENLIKNHINEISEKKDGIFHGNQIDIKNPIDNNLNLYFKDFFIRGEMVVNSLKKFCKYIGYDVNFMFLEDEKKYKNGLRKFPLKQDDHRFKYLSQMIKNNKISWYIKFNDLRNDIEHDGFSLPEIKYGLDEKNCVTTKLPKFHDQTIEEIMDICWNNMRHLCEEIIVFLLSLRLDGNLIMIEIEKENRDKDMPIKYSVRHKDFPYAHFSC